MGDRTGQQGTQVFYDPEMGQYYTQAPATQDNNGMAKLFNLLSGNVGNNRTYLTGFGKSPSMQNMSPYQYADVSLESLFPQMTTNSSQLGNSALAGLLGGAPSATGSASSGAGRFM